LANDGWWLYESPSIVPAQAPQRRHSKGQIRMTSLAPPLPEAVSVRMRLLPCKLVATLALAGLADWLFYNQLPGISAVIFAITLVTCSLLINWPAADRSRTQAAVVVTVVGLIPAIEYLDTLSILLLALAIGLALAILSHPKLDSVRQGVRALRELFAVAPFRLTRDAFTMFSLPAFASGLAAWIVPVLLSCVFAMLFVAANPLIENSLRWIDLSRIADQLSVPRILFWLVMLSFVWPFIHIRWKKSAVAPIPVLRDMPREFLNAATILRSLILFNLLFAVQTALDAIYLWGNVALPTGITYATYAHRGAYPLIVTALLAAGFVLVAMRPGGAAERSKVIRPLVYLWVAQNVMLVISSILRLDLYVRIYFLTHWRVAAFIWMLLVAAGLLLIVARIALGRPNEWLVRMNLITLMATLYVCALVNFTAIIADYNVSHSREVSGQGINLDMGYLHSLGPHALPALDRLGREDPALVSRRNCLVERFRRESSSWRAWSFRNARLQRYLDSRQAASAVPGG
jgi:hypothetical protein